MTPTFARPAKAQLPKNRKLFRIDDISLNTDGPRLLELTHALLQKVPDALIVFAVSPCVHDMQSVFPDLHRERVFPKSFNTKSDHRWFYMVDNLGLPGFLADYPDAIIASHGLVHVDHRLLSRKAQELSVLVSCSLLKTNLFVPPFHKFNGKTRQICDTFGIHLVEYDPGTWRHLAYHDFDEDHNWYYFHTHDFDVDTLRKRLKA